MKFDLREIPFSVRGSYMAISWLDASFRGEKREEGLYLRTVHGAARDTCVARIEVLQDGIPCPFVQEAYPEKLVLSADCGKLTLVYEDEDTLLIGGEGRGIGIRLDFLPSGEFNFIQPVLAGKEEWYLANSFKSYTRYMLSARSGGVKLRQEWKGSGAEDCQFDVSAAEDGLLVVVEEVKDSWKCRRKKKISPGCDGQNAREMEKPDDAEGESYEIEAACRRRKEAFGAFWHSMPSVPEELEETREKAAYVNWCSIVSKSGRLKREAMLMSKNWMCNVWSWDHCFNALALAYHQPEMAWDQFMIMFDHQTRSGRIPDSINDSIVIDNYCKPPIHGWTLHKMRGIMELSREQLEEAYEKIGKWTDWWLEYRDQDEDGLCEYTHGNDSGWDNATAFCALPPVTLPDLAAFLILQMEELGEIAVLLDREKEASVWKKRAAFMMEQMLGKLFPDGRPQAVQTVTGEKIENDSLILYLPVILGKRLPEDVRAYLVGQLKSSRFLTQYGLATESPKSRCYVSDGYWRGPIWAPSTMLIADGLRECGEAELAKEIADRFCKMTERSGFAENFDALTGEGLRDRAYTWTASVMLVMAHEYLDSGM